MTQGQFELSSDKLRRIHADRHRAERAMLQLIVLRDADGIKTPNLDPASHEGWVRSQVFRLQHESLLADPDGEYDTPRELSLEAALANPILTTLAQPGRPLTPERLIEIDPSLLVVSSNMDAQGIGWPSSDNVFHDVLPEDFDDTSFGLRIVNEKYAYNNFPAILATYPNRPFKGEELLEFMNRTANYQYATKPYVARAHALQPDFMGALQSRMADMQSLSDWQASVFCAVNEDHPDPDDRILLRASRLAYQLLINLMRKDDLQIQSRLITLSMQQEITDPTKELWT